MMVRTVTAEAPLNGSSAAPTAPAESPPRARPVLVVEDNDLARCELQKLLQADPQLQVDLASDGEQAMQALTEHEYSLLITDLRLPNGDGMEILKKIQER